MNETAPSNAIPLNIIAIIDAFMVPEHFNTKDKSGSPPYYATMALAKILNEMGVKAKSVYLSFRHTDSNHPGEMIHPYIYAVSVNRVICGGHNKYGWGAITKEFLGLDPSVEFFATGETDYSLESMDEYTISKFNAHYLRGRALVEQFTLNSNTAIARQTQKAKVRL